MMFKMMTCGVGFQGDLRKSPITGHLEPFYPAWKRNVFRYCVSTPIILLCLLFVFYIMLLIFQLQEWVNWAVVAGDAPTFLRFGPKVLMAIAIAFMDDLYKQLAIFLNNKGEGGGRIGGGGYSHKEAKQLDAFLVTASRS